MEVDLLQVLQFLYLPFIMCLILVGIHCYLGFHVLTRGVIFVDLSLAQIAAFGFTLSFAIGFGLKSAYGYLSALLCTFIAAALFARARKFEHRISQEAIIGIVYALGSAAVILASDQMAHGTEHLKSILIGQILWVSWPDVLKISLIYSTVGIIHFIFRDKFFASSKGELDKNKGLWDFLFYALFGIVITSSVSVAGVLQVFAYLIVPSVVANYFFKEFKHRLFFGWGVGFFVSLIGMIISYSFDLPSGACIVVSFALIPILLIVFSKPNQANEK